MKYKLGDYQGALNDYNAVIDMNPSAADAFYGRGSAKYQLKDYNGAISDWNTAIDMEPSYTKELQPWLDKAKAKIGSSDSSSDNSGKKDYFKSGYNKYENGDYKGAVEDYTKSLAEKKDVNANYNRGLAYYKLRNYDAAIADFSEVINNNPEDSEAYYNRGLAKYGKEDDKGALADYNMAIRLNPNYANAYYGRGSAKYQLGNYEGAIADWNKSIELEPANKEELQPWINKAKAKLQSI